MDLDKLTSFNKIYPLFIKRFDSFQPIDENESITSKINDMITYLNDVGQLTNDVVKDWNDVMKWVLDEGFSDVIDQKIASGMFDTILQQFSDAIENKINNNLTDLNDHIATITQNAQNQINLIEENQVMIPTNGAGTPSENANTIGQIYIDTTNEVAYVSISVGNGPNDWKQITN